MQIRSDIMRRHLEQAAIEQLTAEYRDKGYAVVPAPENGGGDADLVMRRGDESIYFELSSQPPSLERRARLTRVHRHVRSRKNARLQLVIVRRPEPPEIDIEEFESRLLRLCAERADVLGFAATGYSARPKRVTDVRFDAIKVKRGGIGVVGVAAGRFELACEGSCAFTDWFTLHFHLTLDHDLEIALVESLSADVSGYVDAE